MSCHALSPSFRSLVGALVMMAAASVPGCSDDAGEDGGAAKKPTASAPWLIQEDLDDKAWKDALGKDAELATLAGEVKLAFQAAGSIEDEDGAAVLWAEFAKDKDDARDKIEVVLRVCDKAGACVRARGKYTADGATLTAGGKALETIALGTPWLTKKLKTSNVEAGTVIMGELSSKAIVEPELAKFFADTSSWGKRRLLLINRFGSHVGADLATITKAAQETGLFDEIEQVQYARRRDIDLWLPQLTAQDVVVWVAAGVVKPFGGKPYRSLGMTVSRGVLGDELYHTASLGNALDAPPLGGPGLVILAGGNSLTTNKANADVLAKALNLGPYRPVVGVEGHVTLAEAEAGVAALLQELAGGKTLDKAMAAASGKLESATFTTAMIEEQSEVWKLAAAPSKFWDKAPSTAELGVYVKIDPLCADVSAFGGKCTASTLQKGTAIPPAQITPILDTKFSCKPTFNGPYFSCTEDNPTLKAKFWLKGLLTGRAAGDSVLVVAQGQSDGKVRDFTVVGTGVIAKVDEGGGTTVISFDGDAAGSTFWNQDNQCCIAKAPRLIGHATNLLSKLEIKP